MVAQYEYLMAEKSDLDIRILVKKYSALKDIKKYHIKQYSMVK